MPRLLLAVVATLISVPSRALSQSLGDTIRVTSPTLGLYQLHAIYLDHHDDSLYLRTLTDSTHVVALPVAAVTKLEVQRDRTKPTGAELGGGIAGMVIGAAVTTIVMENNGYAVCGECDVPDLGYYAAVGGAIVGGLVGYAVGHSMSGGDYHPVSLGFAPRDQPRSERRVAVTIAPTWVPSARAPGLSFGIRF